ncbi:uncharacterized protein [Venturia canescens]|uniref:uncharacterized protein isoform X2 n=1 Tax=Venturia canescens TaxID=32260 RepID=UPI001C9CC7D4|nr:uncharacterized protein LOC122413949 isoform X2 [Venturia canescens]
MFSTLGYARVVSATQFECIVCRLTKNTVAELHRHQTFLHTTEELSLAVIGLRNSLINNAVNSQNATSCSWLYKPLKHSEFYSLSAILLDDEHNFARFERSVPLDCVVKRKCANTEELCVPKARLLKTLEDKRIRRREQNRRAKIFRTLNNGVLDLSLPKSSRKGKSKLKNTVANTFYQGNIQSAAILDSRKEKKLSKETSGNKKRMDNPAPLKQEPISMDEEYREEKKTAMPQTTHLLDEVLKLAVKSFKNEESLENSIYDDDAEETSECSNLVVDEFSHLGSSSIPLRVELEKDLQRNQKKVL